MATLLLAEVAGGQLNDATARALTAALELGEPVDVLVAGHGVGVAAEAAAKLQGVAKVLVADEALYAHGLAEPLAALIVTLAPGYDAIVAPSTASVELDRQESFEGAPSFDATTTSCDSSTSAS